MGTERRPGEDEERVSRIRPHLVAGWYRAGGLYPEKNDSKHCEGETGKIKNVTSESRKVLRRRHSGIRGKKQWGSTVPPADRTPGRFLVNSLRARPIQIKKRPRGRHEEGTKTRMTQVDAIQKERFSLLSLGTTKTN